MKKINIALASLFALSLISCNKELTPSDPTPSTDANLVQKTFYASYNQDETKVAVGKIGDNSIDLKWQTGDEVHILSEGQTLGDAAVALIDESNESNASFEPWVPEGSTKYFAVYPASAVSTTDTWVNNGERKALRVNVPAEQNGVHTSFDPKAYLASAFTTDDHLSFKPLVSAIRFELGDLAPSVEKVVFTANDVDNVAGSGLLYTDNFSNIVSDASKAAQVTLSKPTGGFQKGKTYYITFIPNTCPNGITLYVYLNDNTVKKLSSSTALFEADPCGKVKSFGVLPETKMKDVNLYEQYCAGIDVKFGDITVNKATHGEATLLNASSETKVIGKSGVYFLDPTYEAGYPLTSETTGVIVSSISNQRAVVNRTAYQTLSSGNFILANVTFKGATSSSYLITCNSSDINTFALYNVGIEVPVDKHLLHNNKKNILNIYMEKCDVKLNDGTADNNLFNINTSYTFESVVFRNNIVWNSNHNRAGFRFVAAQNCPVTSLEISYNTVAGVYCKAAYGYVSVKSITTGKANNNLFLLNNYATMIPANNTGIIWLPNGTDESGLTILSNLAYYDESIPANRLLGSYYTKNGIIYNKDKTENPVPSPDYTNGVFTQGSSYKTFGATR